MLRLILISATLFSTFMGWRYPTIYLDVQTFNLIFIILNGYLSFKLIMKLIPPKFSSEERKLYNRYFSRYFRPNEYRKLLDYSRRRVYRVNSTIVNTGNGFSSLFFVVDISDDNVKLELKINGNVIKSLSTFGWVGIVEYIEVINKQTLTQAIQSCEYGTWGINLEVNFNIGEVNESEASASYEEESYFDESLSKINRELVLYEWDLEVEIF
jgi:hypothetical protein